MRILFIGDIVAKVGREAVRKLLPGLVEEHKIDVVIANGENATHGRGLTKKHYQQLKQMGVDVVTLGNHFDDRQEIRDYIGRTDTLVRPINLIEEYPGSGSVIFVKNGVPIRVTNIMLEAFMKRPVQSPYASLGMLINESIPGIHIVDVHGEATAEKMALAYAYDGQVTAMLGTHTHVQTRDYQVLPNGTAYISDVGMTGPKNGIIGVEKNSVIKKMWFDKETHYVYNEKDEGLLSAVVIDVDEITFKARDIYPLYLTVR